MTLSPRLINGRAVNPVGLGCMSLSWAYGVPPSEDDAIAVLRRALDIGYDHFDTANIYGGGHNETLIGKALGADRQRVFLASKMGIVVDGPNRGIDCSPAAIHRCIDETLKRLQTDHIDLYYMHRYDPKVPIADSVGAMADLVKAGKIGSIGLSEWSGPHIREAAAIHPVAAVQTEYSLWTRNPEIAVLDACRDNDIAFVAFSPVGRGVLANGIDVVEDLPETDLRRKMPRFNAENWPKNRALLDHFVALAQEAGVTPSQLALSWVNTRDANIVSIPGTANRAHLEENMARWDWVLPDELASQVDALINQETVSGPRYAAGIQATIDTEEFA